MTVMGCAVALVCLGAWAQAKYDKYKSDEENDAL